MELEQIRAYLDSPNAQERMKAIVELRNYNPGIVVPLLKQRMYDQELIIRSFVAIGLGKKRNQEGFDALLNLIEYKNKLFILKESNLLKGSLEYKLSLIIDTLLNIERKKNTNTE